ncbi:MAG: hypothetical protein ACRDBP_01220 [Luteolibacter sp.]
MSRPLTLLLALAASLATLPGTSCVPLGESWMAGRMAAEAKDQIMLVRAEPPSFGYHRLAYQSQVYPDLAVFVRKHGLPDFLAETGERGRQYFILYYLAERKAFACRTTSAEHSVEFAGPYPITAREFRLLDGFRRDPTKKPTTL